MDNVMQVRAAIAGQPGQGGPAGSIVHIITPNAEGQLGTYPVIFFDNDMAKISQVYAKCKQMEVVRVGESAVRAINNTVTNGWYAPLWDGHNIDDNAYSQLNVMQATGHMEFDIYSGMQEREFAIIDDWVVRSAALGVPRTAVFDWDRTLTMVEGIRIARPPPYDIIGAMAPYYPGEDVPKNFVEDMLIYLCGGLQRLNTLRAMFVFLRENEIDIKILTNNPSAGNVSEPLFKELVNALVAIPDYDVEVWCSYNPPANGDKGIIMRQKFPGLCAMVGGRRRRRKTKRQSKRFRRTRR
jgi:hypothetical protein